MPLKRGTGRKTMSSNIREFHKGPTYAATKRKFGAARANRQAVAVASREECQQLRFHRENRAR